MIIILSSVSCTKAGSSTSTLAYPPSSKRRSVAAGKGQEKMAAQYEEKNERRRQASACLGVLLVANKFCFHNTGSQSLNISYSYFSYSTGLITLEIVSNHLNVIINYFRKIVQFVSFEIIICQLK